MFFTYLRRELLGRRKQTIVVAIGMALAIALVIVVNAFSTGIRDAQSSVLSSVYGVGTDITVTQTAEPGSRGPGADGGPGQFGFGADDGQTTEDGTRQLSSDRLSTAPGTQSFDAGALTTVSGLDHVAAASATLVLTDLTFSGEMPDPQSFAQGAGDGQGNPSASQAPPAGGPDGAGGSAFSVDTFSVTGVDPASDAVGPLTTLQVSEGRGLEATDNGTDPAAVAVLDGTYASSASLSVGDTLTVAGTDLSVVGIVTSTDGDDVATGSDVYLPLALAQSLSGLEAQVSTVYVQADSADQVEAVATAIAAAVPDATVSTQSDLASSVSGSLSTAADLVSTWGTWLSVIVLVAAFGLAVLFTVSGVTRRTRELGTLKAIGWPRRRVVGQIAGESLVQGVLGGVLGVGIGALAVAGINLAGITLSGSSGATFTGPGGRGAEGFAGGPGGGPFGEIASSLSTTTDVVLHTSISVTIAVIAIGLALLGGLLAGVIGGRRAARLRPAEALRSNS